MSTAHAETRTEQMRRHNSRETEAQLERNIAYYAAQSDEVIAERIEELKQEWSLERCLQANVATLGVIGCALGLLGRKRYLWLAASAFGFLLYNGVRGCEPAISQLRRMGLRARAEIDREIYALRVLRGDFKNASIERPELKPIPAKEILQAIKA